MKLIVANELVEKIKVFSNDDESLKKLGELLGNDTSRKIIRLLIENEMYTNEIANTLNLRVSLVIHHLKKMQELGLLKISHKQIVRKGNQHRYFRMIPGLFVLPNETKEEIENKGLLKRIFKDGIKFASIFIAFLIGTTFSKTKEILVDTSSSISKGNAMGALIEKVEPKTDSLSIEILIIIFVIIPIFYWLLKKRKRG